MRIIERDELLQLMRNSPDLVLVEVLGHDHYERYHLPGAINVQVDNLFEDHIERAIPDKDRPIVVYCTRDEPAACRVAAERLDALGYTHVYDYEGGKEEWREAGLPVER